MNKQVSSWHIGIAAEAFAAAQFARYGINVSVQYGANQPEYDLIASKGDTLLKVSVKGSQDGGWGLTQNYKKASCSYHEAVDAWLKNHGKKTIFCLVQFQNIKDEELPLIYLATPSEIAKAMKASRNGLGDTVLRVYHKWGGKAQAAGTVDTIPNEWLMTKKRVDHFFK
jgi:Predicted endonuclease distantly related to archaeal Holliday junction resolvase